MSATSLFPELKGGRKPKPAPSPAMLERRLTHDPFRIEGDASISFSGGRTSAYMLRRCLDAGFDPKRVHVTFANTGKEREETLQFVRDVETYWGVRVRWVEWLSGDKAENIQFQEVSFETAARNGEPFRRLCQAKKAIPNRTMRFCTEVLKIETMRAFLFAQGLDAWEVLIGIRGDEPKRVAKIRGRHQPENEDLRLPLWDAGIDKREVLAFWGGQPFDLKLSPHESNCDLCFLKGWRNRFWAMKREPWRAEFWLELERETGATFINPQTNRPQYQQLYHLAVAQQEVLVTHQDWARAAELAGYGLDDEESFDCLCGE